MAFHDVMSLSGLGMVDWGGVTGRKDQGVNQEGL